MSYDAAMPTRNRWFVAASLVAALAFGAACSSSSKADDPPPTPTTVSSDPKQAAVDEARYLMSLLNREKEEDCKTPSFETNITLPEEFGLPIPITRGRCTYD